MRRFNPEPPRCVICDLRLRNQADLIQHQLEHRGSAEELAAGLERAAEAGVKAEGERS